MLFFNILAIFQHLCFFLLNMSLFLLFENYLKYLLFAQASSNSLGHIPVLIHNVVSHDFKPNHKKYCIIWKACEEVVKITSSHSIEEFHFPRRFELKLLKLLPFLFLGLKQVLCTCRQDVSCSQVIHPPTPIMLKG